jgi:ADP-ribose pyrophosphatase YjhB (NUDIX family)
LKLKPLNPFPIFEPRIPNPDAGVEMSGKKTLTTCPHCGGQIEKFMNPVPTADAIIEIEDQFVLIERKNSPLGWAIPGGFVDYGETVEQAAVREAREETTLDVQLVHLLGVYSDPRRDPRSHTITTVFVAKAKGEPKADDDAKAIGLFSKDHMPDTLAFDHRKVLEDYFRWKKMAMGNGSLVIGAGY